VQLTPHDRSCFDRAIQLALKAEAEGNLPIGAVIALNGEIIAEGRNAIWSPVHNPNRHAEIEALRAVPEHFWPQSRKMMLYSTLEPCMMCMGAIYLHRIGRLLYGAADDYGGASCVRGHMPQFFETQAESTLWIGPADPARCDPLFERTMQLISARREDQV